MRRGCATATKYREASQVSINLLVHLSGAMMTSCEVRVSGAIRTPIEAGTASATLGQGIDLSRIDRVSLDRASLLVLGRNNLGGAALVQRVDQLAANCRVASGARTTSGSGCGRSVLRPTRRSLPASGSAAGQRCRIGVDQPIRLGIGACDQSGPASVCREAARQTRCPTAPQPASPCAGRLAPATSLITLIRHFRAFRCVTLSHPWPIHARAGMIGESTHQEQSAQPIQSLQPFPPNL